MDNNSPQKQDTPKIDPAVFFSGNRPQPAPVKQRTIPIRQELPQNGHNPHDIAGKGPIEIKSDSTTFEALQAANIFFADTASKEDPQKVVEALHKETPIQAIHTADTDIQSAAGGKKATVENIIIAEQERAATPKEVHSTRWGLYLLALSGILVLGGVIALGTLYIIRMEPDTPPPIIVDPSDIITTEASQTIIHNNKEPLLAILTSTTKNLTSQNDKRIVRFVVKEGSEASKPIDGVRFAALFSNGMPAWLSRSFKPEYLAGAYDSPHGFQPLFIFKLTSYDNAYAGMLKWEETMKANLALLDVFTEQSATEPARATSTSKTAKETPKSTFENPIIQTGFKDIKVMNKDTRVLEDSTGRRHIYYSFPDKETLVITTDQTTLEEIFARLLTSKFVR